MKENIIAKIDKNFAVQTGSDKKIAFFDIKKEPFKIYGLYKPETEPNLKRMPDDVAKSVSQGVAWLYTNTAGGRIRFSTDSPTISVKCFMPDYCVFGHMAISGTSGFDVFEDTETGSRFTGAFIPPNSIDYGYESIIETPGGKMRNYTVNMPLYNNVTSVYIGIEEGYSLGPGKEYPDLPPIVYYGSSITQGACATRPGNCYTSIVSRKLGLNHINLGFSGSAKGEDEMIEYITSLDMLVFVSDYDHNAPDAEHLRVTAEKLYKAVRAKHPKLPYIIASRPNFREDLQDAPKRRKYLYEIYKNAFEAGDKHIYYIDGQSFFRGPDIDLCTVEWCHPTDVGFLKMADVFESEIRKAIDERE